MILSAKTTISELLKAYPFLIDFLVSYNPKFGMLRNRIMRATMGKMATMKRVAGIGEVPLAQLLEDLAGAIEKETGVATAVEAGGESAPDIAKTAALKDIILGLHKGVPFDEAKARFAALISDIDSSEIVAMEERIIQEGVPAEEVARLSELHVAVMREALDKKETPQAIAGHPVHTFMAENEQFTQAVGDLNLLLQQLRLDGSAEKFKGLAPALKEVLDRVARVDVHFQRKENQLFPFFEKHGITGPSQVMWTADDNVRANLKAARRALEEEDLEALLEKGAAAAGGVTDMIYKENSILFPLALDTLDESEWIEIRSGEDDIGYAFDVPGTDWPGEKAIDQARGASISLQVETDQLPLDTGALYLEQINLMLKALPLDITFVDENDRVQYFSAGKERLFPRSPGIIGREVQNCHPPKSIDTVNRIVAEFRAGTKDVAEFWIRMQKRLIYIRYFAVRDDNEKYRGTIEVSQDITDIQNIEGERRLLDWDAADA